MKFIKLTQGKRAMVDDEDYERLIKYSSWSAYQDRYKNNWYAKTWWSEPMHRTIMNPSSKFVIDHINHNGLDNRKKNLRITTQQTNVWNRKGANSTSKSGIRGVHWHKREKHWVVSVCFNYYNHQLGGFKNLKEAQRLALNVRHMLTKIHYGKRGECHQ